MDLRNAIAKATKFTWKGKQRSPSKSVRFVPGPTGLDMGPAVWATNGPQSIWIWLDPGTAVPDIMVDAERLNAAVKGQKDVTFANLANGSVELSGVKLEIGNIQEFPAVPFFAMPPYMPVHDWPIIQKVIHAVSRDTQQPVLRCVHFRPDLVEATDRFRVARAFVQTSWEALVPAAIFAHWPEGEVTASFVEDRVVFRVKDEMRCSILKTGTFQNCDTLVPARFEGARVVVHANELLGIASRAKGLTTAVRVTFLEHDVRIDGGGVDEQLVIMDQRRESLQSRVALRVNATWFWEALRNVSTPRVVLGYTYPGEPLRIESGPYTVALWAIT